MLFLLVLSAVIQLTSTAGIPTRGPKCIRTENNPCIYGKYNEKHTLSELEACEWGDACFVNYTKLANDQCSFDTYCAKRIIDVPSDAQIILDIDGARCYEIKYSTHKNLVCQGYNRNIRMPWNLESYERPYLVGYMEEESFSTTIDPSERTSGPSDTGGPVDPPSGTDEPVERPSGTDGPDRTSGTDGPDRNSGTDGPSGRTSGTDGPDRTSGTDGPSGRTSSTDGPDRTSGTDGPSGRTSNTDLPPILEVSSTTDRRTAETKTTTKPSTTTKTPTTTKPSTTTKAPTTTKPSTTTKSTTRTKPSTTTKSSTTSKPSTTTKPRTTTKAPTTTSDDSTDSSGKSTTRIAVYPRTEDLSPSKTTREPSGVSTNEPSQETTSDYDDILEVSTEDVNDLFKTHSTPDGSSGVGSSTDGSPGKGSTDGGPSGGGSTPGGSPGGLPGQGSSTDGPSDGSSTPSGSPGGSPGGLPGQGSSTDGPSDGSSTPSGSPGGSPGGLPGQGSSTDGPSDGSSTPSGSPPGGPPGGLPGQGSSTGGSSGEPSTPDGPQPSTTTKSPRTSSDNSANPSGQSTSGNNLPVDPRVTPDSPLGTTRDPSGRPSNEPIPQETDSTDISGTTDVTTDGSPATIDPQLRDFFSRLIDWLRHFSGWIRSQSSHTLYYIVWAYFICFVYVSAHYICKWYNKGK